MATCVCAVSTLCSCIILTEELCVKDVFGKKHDCSAVYSDTI